MPRQAIAYLIVIILASGGALLLAANLLRVQKSWSDSLADVKESNQTQAVSLVAQQRAAEELQAALAQANLGWDRMWNQVGTTPNAQNGNLQVRIGSDAGITATDAPMMLHGFMPDDTGGFIYVGPFLARQENIRNADSTLVPGWDLLLGADASEASSWRQGQWRFRTQIPAEHKVRFESLVDRFRTNLQTLGQKRNSIQKQDVLFKTAEEQLEQRNSELIGRQDAEGEGDPLRPEDTEGLENAIEGEEEGRNLLQLEIDAFRRAIQDLEEENGALENKVNSRRSGSLGNKPARIGSRK